MSGTAGGDAGFWADVARRARLPRHRRSGPVGACDPPGEPGGAPPDDSPAWLEFIRAAAARGAVPWDLPSPGDEPVPFTAALAPVGREAVERLRARAGDGRLELLSPDARDELFGSVMPRLARLAAPALQALFDAERDGRPNAVQVVLAEADAEPARAQYDGFAREMAEAGLRPMYSRYPVAGRLLGEAALAWVDAQTEMLDRLARHPPPSDPESDGDGRFPVTSLTPGLSDVHPRGRAVAAVEMADGASWLYKPKPIDADANWAELLRWLAERGAPADAGPVRFVPHAGWGWARWVDHRPCGSDEEARRFHLAFGALIAVLYALRGDDAYAENVIAHGPAPVLIDAETALGLDVPPPSNTVQPRPDTVLSTAVLPWWVRGNVAGEAINVGALGGGREQRWRVRAWRAVDTDAVAFMPTERLWPDGPNVPMLRGEPVSPLDHVNDVVEGFATTYDVLRRTADELLEPGSPLRALAGGAVRLVLRATRNYALVLDRLVEPESLRDGVQADRALRLLNRPYRDVESPPHAALLGAERRALLRGEIPRFFVAGSGVSDDERVPPELARPVSLDELASRLGRLSDADRDTQSGLVRAALLALRLDGTPRPAEAPADSPPADASPADAPRAGTREADAPGADPSRADELIAHAHRLALAIADAAIPGPNGGPAWIGYSLRTDTRRLEPSVLGPALYGGTAGIALFLAAVARTTGDDRVGGLAADALLAATDRPNRTMAEGGIAGRHSLAYVRALHAQLTGEGAAAADGFEPAGFVTPASDAHDVTLGTAGSLFMLLALARRASGGSRAGLVAAARDLGDRLLEARVGEHGGRSWPASDYPPLAGFAHGAAGIALALSDLADATGQERFRRAADEARAYEDGLFVPEAGGWRDLRGPEGLIASPSWCHGAAGIALARLDLPESADSDSLVSRALDQTAAVGAGVVDHLCCGAVGRAEILLEAGRRLGADRWESEARALLDRVLDRARTDGGFRYIDGTAGGFFEPSFFRGAAGIGWSLLRFAGEELPCVLRLE